MLKKLSARLFSESSMRLLGASAASTSRVRNLADDAIHHGEDKKLFTPGPLGTSLTVKQAMLRDFGSRDIQFMETVKYIRKKLLDIAGVSDQDFTSIPLQGSGTYAVESIFQSTVPRNGGKVLILENGAYGKRMGKICDVLSIDTRLESFPEDSRVDVVRVEEILSSGEQFTHVAVVHCETSSGVFNPIEKIGQIVKKQQPGAVYFVDAMSSFGAVPLDITGSHIDYVVSSANKCLQGIPGFSFIIARTASLLQCQGFSRSLSLDIVDQYKNLEATGQFRFTPPTHAMFAFKKALEEFEEEGGLLGRSKRYKDNHEILRTGMKRLGFREMLDSSHEGYIITSYWYPQGKDFIFQEFYDRLNNKGQVIYPGKVLQANCFRIGNIGQLFPEDMTYLVKCIEEVCKEMNIVFTN